MARKLNAAVAYTSAIAAGLLASWLVCYSVVLTVPKESQPAPHPATPLVFVGTLLFVFVALGAMLSSAFATRHWALMGLSLGGSGFLLYLACWWLGGPARMAARDVLPLATPLIAALIGTYAGTWLRGRRRVA